MSNKKKSYNDRTNPNREKKKNDYLAKSLGEEKELNEPQKSKNSENTSVSIIEKNELNTLVDEDLGIKKKKSNKGHVVVHLFLVLLLILAVVFFALSIFNSKTSIPTLIGNLVLTLFTIFFVIIGITYNRKKKGGVFFCGLLLFGYITFLIGSSIYEMNVVSDFRGKAVTDAIEWAAAKKITVTQEYEYSDMVDEYKVISQNVKEGTLLKKIKEITLSISEGPNPSKEIIVPSMITWDSERVLEFIKKNYLTNVEVEFVESDKMKDTVIEQSTSGNLKRDDKLKLTFSYGEELGYEEVSLIDFTGMTKFEVEFYMKQHQLEYEFDYDFSSKIKKGKAIKQSIKAGKKVKVKDEKIKITLSKGPKIKVPNLKKMSAAEISEWAIRNKLKIEFTDDYDDSVKENEVISVNYKKNDVVEQGTVIKIVLSRGSLKMPKFKSLSDFREWADKYKVKYEEKHEFSDDVKSGEVISYSYKTGAVIKNNDSIIVKISDGKKCKVPDLDGLTKSEAISRLEKANLKYTFVYKASNKVSKDRVISQSMSSGSEVAEGTTVTVTLSNGKKESSSSSSSSKNNNSGSSSSSKPSGGSSGNSGSNNKPVTPTCDRSRTTMVYIYDELISSTPSATCSKIKSAYPGIKFACNYVKNPGLANGLVSNSGSIDGRALNYCDTYTINIVSN